jgi:hypothetical protein
MVCQPFQAGKNADVDIIAMLLEVCSPLPSSFIGYVYRYGFAAATAARQL